MTAKQILVIDDDRDICKLTQTCLDIMGGWKVLTVSSGSEGLAMAQSAQPDAILLDLMMPDMDGMTTLQRLQANQATRHIPIILLTATRDSFDRSRLAELGVKGAINKPFKPLKLADQIAEALGWSA